MRNSHPEAIWESAGRHARNRWYGRSAEDLAGIVDSGGIRYGEPGVGGN